jgi:hypothetical protein
LFIIFLSAVHGGGCKNLTIKCMREEKEENEREREQESWKERKRK